ncbi:hypothetical protein [Sphingomonas asaccharolytica]|uniref:hypothetical protein n=1 Tax=Sphingomonas asaccharolytica TaxID=40681 RepID=UPI000833AE9B|nr:hypothetical protein [Sphingomonas asaccharolytica]
MAGPRSVAAVICLIAVIAGLVVATLENGRMAIAVHAIERRPRSFWRPAILIWRDYARLCPGGLHLHRALAASAVAMAGAIGLMLCLA